MTWFITLTCKPPSNIPVDYCEIQAPSLIPRQWVVTELRHYRARRVVANEAYTLSVVSTLDLSDVHHDKCKRSMKCCQTCGLINSVSSFHRGPIHADSIRSGMIIRWVDLHSVSTYYPLHRWWNVSSSAMGVKLSSRWCIQVRSHLRDIESGLIMQHFPWTPWRFLLPSSHWSFYLAEQVRLSSVQVVV